MTIRKTPPSKPKMVILGTDDVALQLLAKTPLTGQSIKRLKGIRYIWGTAKNKKVSGRISGELLDTVKNRLGVTSDTDAIEMSLANMAITDDFGTWLVDQAGQLDQDFVLEL